jgi:GTP-binding protein Era
MNEHRTGMVALVGRPNVGKSSLMNYLVGDKISIITPVAQTTRNQIRGIQNLPEAQIVYLDTPGIHHPRKVLNRYMVEVALRSLEEVDLILYLIDASRPDPDVLLDAAHQIQRETAYRGEDALILERLKQNKTPAFLVVNKIDLINEKTLLLPVIAHYTSGGKFEEVIPISATTGEGVDTLQREIIKRLAVGAPLFPTDFSTDMAERFLVSEIIREKLILQTRQELPHSTAVLIEQFDESERGDEYGDGAIAPSGDDDLIARLTKELVTAPQTKDVQAAQHTEIEAEHPESSSVRDDMPIVPPPAKTAGSKETKTGLVRIDATIVVERDSQKGIVIGKNGAMLKEIGTAARLDIEHLLGCRVFLKLWVKVEKNWSKSEKAMRRLGYSSK